jgi:predicted acylesterase/phospholipase RssA
MTLINDFFNWLSKLLKALWLFLAGVIAVAAMYYLLIGVEQGIDVVIQSGELLDSGVLSVLAVFLWSFLVWYSSRTLSYIRQRKDDELFSKKASGDVTSRMLYEKYCIPSSFYQHIPRMLAFNCFVCVQVAIFHLPTFFGWSGVVMFIVVLLHNAFYFSLHYWFQSKRSSLANSLLRAVNVIVIISYAAFLAFLIFQYGDADLGNDPFRHRFWLSVIALSMFAFEVLVIFLFILRRRNIDERRKDLRLRPSAVLDALGFNPAFNAAEAPYFTLLNSVAGIAVIVYVLAIFVMSFSDLMGPMAFTLLALGVLTGLSNLVTLISIRISFNIMIILLALTFLFGQYRDPYPVRLLATGEKAVFDRRPDVKTYLGRWFERRITLMKERGDDSKFPVYIVLSSGGASRAGKWTGSVLTHLQDSSYNVNPRDSFRDHVLCIAGASGGSVGNSAFYSLLKAQDEGAISGNEFRQHANSFFETDFLTFTIAHLLGPDILRHLIPFNIAVDNRADALEKVISKGSGDSLLNSFFEKPLTDVFDTTGALPVLFINTTQVDNGMPGVISTVKLPSGSQRQDVLALVDSMSVHSEYNNMRLSTAAILSSRFPYVSPAGKVFDRYYVDGGYFDNSGSGTVLEFIQELNGFLSDSSNAEIIRYRERFTFHLLRITNSEVISRPSQEIHPMTNDLLAPILTLAGMQGSSTDIGDGMLTNAFRQFNTDTANAMVVYSLYDETWDISKRMGQYEEGYPMSWTLSAYQINRMNAALSRANKVNIPKLRFYESE